MRTRASADWPALMWKVRCSGSHDLIVTSARIRLYIGTHLFHSGKSLAQSGRQSLKLGAPARVRKFGNKLLTLQILGVPNNFITDEQQGKCQRESDR